MKTHRDPQEIRNEIREVLKDYTQLQNADREDYKILKAELIEAEKFQHQNKMFLFIEGQNIVNRHFNKVVPTILERINNIMGEKFLNMDNSRNHKFKDLFDDLETTDTKATKKYKYRLTTRTRVSYNSFILDISIYIWNEDSKQDYKDSIYLANLENATSFKELYEFKEMPIFNVNREYKKLLKYEEQKKKLDSIRAGLNSSFMKVFSNGYNRDHY